MSKLNKKEIMAYLSEFETGTGLKVTDGESHILSSNNGLLKVTFRLNGNMPCIFTSLVTNKSGYNLFKDFVPFGYSAASGKQNYFNDGIYTFLNHHIVSFDIEKSSSAITAKI